eukprot:gnl/MRDRNA2_/MRDRNA2_82522_c0_seq1.p1 gnl/MRDRNA2_/MRDRNA2_82522_c0~~gnl/MRDRNA2_/MRDRNA2_82522_c0_seq1.p1  ORF type:complete len:249 (-),score=59.74 gnl/MRDRNA2_/MRDRNA2_82522_c0_seq1:43-789(-)
MCTVAADPWRARARERRRCCSNMHLYSLVPKEFVEEDGEKKAGSSLTCDRNDVAHDVVGSDLRREYSIKVKGRPQRTSLLQFQRTLRSLLEEETLRMQHHQQQDENRMSESLQHTLDESEQLRWALEESRRVAQEVEAQRGLQENAYLDEWLNPRPPEPEIILSFRGEHPMQDDHELSPELEQRLQSVVQRELQQMRDFARDAIEVAPLVATWAAAAATTTASAATLGGAGAATVIVVAAAITTCDGL